MIEIIAEISVHACDDQEEFVWYDFSHDSILLIDPEYCTHEELENEKRNFILHVAHLLENIKIRETK